MSSEGHSRYESMQPTFMEVKASLNYLRISPRKVRIIAQAIRGLSATRARTVLMHASKRAAGPLGKLLQSAVANGKQNFQLDEGALVVKNLRIDPGPMLKRWRARAFGRSAVIRKRTSHISLVLSTTEKIEAGNPKSETMSKSK